MFDKQILEDLKELKLGKAELDKSLKGIKEQIEKKEAQVLDMLQKTGLDQVKAEGYTFSINRKLNGGVTGGVVGVEALIKAGMVDCTMVGHQRMGSVIREFVGAALDDNPLLSLNETKTMFEDEYPQLRGLVSLHEKYGVQMRKAT